MNALHEATLETREFKAVQRLIFELAGISLADSKQIMVQGRLLRRLRALQIESYAEYLDLVRSQSNREEVTQFINALTTNKTDFFRENHHFDFLQQTLFPQLRERAENGSSRNLRIWCSASSTGEEPYTIAMCVREFFGLNSGWDIRILASDIDTNVLTVAATGSYPDDRVVDIPKPWLHRYFTSHKTTDGTTWQANQSLRDLITFRRINLQQPDWPIKASFDIIFCRNVMIYFNQDTQRRLIDRFANQLTEEGHLIIGHSESLFGISDRFKPIGNTIYARTDSQEKPPGRTTSRVNRFPAIEATPPALPETVAEQTPKPRSVRTEKNCGKEYSSQKKGACSFSGTTAATAPSRNLLETIGNDPRYPIIVGEVHASGQSVWISTLLGSCVAVCLYDETTGTGGMNHFMLPSSQHNPDRCASYGVHAMELLINAIMKQGGDRRRLKAKVFGGAAVVRSNDARWNVGDRNIEFAKNFLDTEHIPVTASHTGGNCGMHVYFNPQSARVLIRLLDQNASRKIQEQALVIEAPKPAQPDITLF